MTTKSCTCGGYTSANIISRHSEPRSEHERGSQGHSHDRETFPHPYDHIHHHHHHRFLPERRRADNKAKRRSEESHNKAHMKLHIRSSSKQSSASSIGDSSDLEDSPPPRRGSGGTGRRVRHYTDPEFCSKHGPFHHRHHHQSAALGHYHLHKPSTKYSSSHDRHHPPVASRRSSFHNVDDDSSVESPNKFDEPFETCDCGCRCWETIGTPSNESLASSVSDDWSYADRRGRDHRHQQRKSRKKKKKKRCNII